ncbi:Uncharacterised protein [Legionella pneumophila]|nr:Uncharacterised protein [Legionella pneumophila]CZI38197.1 Uncharacterised protein [Legionella pneumophila]CZI47610.1 Uncharacterised protein [Legionella pneumophila]CZI52206.1 Uncharacterised protein [Legionella pneumophila]CZQ97261.1 Uncharacterised protein [Legionella pneumophila]
MQSGRFISMTAIYTIMLLSKPTIAGTAGDSLGIKPLEWRS